MLDWAIHNHIKEKRPKLIMPGSPPHRKPIVIPKTRDAFSDRFQLGALIHRSGVGTHHGHRVHALTEVVQCVDSPKIHVGMANAFSERAQFVVPNGGTNALLPGDRW
jgi:hypothetical protein